MQKQKSNRRAQTTLDFALGVSVFLLAVVFVIGFVPTMFDPFAGGTGTRLIVADRAATLLAGDILVSSTADPGMLVTGCVAGFFEGPTGNQSLADASCSATVDVADLDGALTLDGANVNVTIHELGDPASNPANLEWDGRSVTLSRSNSESIPSDVAVATRTVSIDNRQYQLTVQVW